MLYNEIISKLNDIVIAENGDITVVVPPKLDVSNGTTVLGSVSNINISGGNSGQFLQTDGTGNVTWANVVLDHIEAGNSSITVAPNANITMTVMDSNVAVFNNGGLYLDGYLETTSRVYPESLEFANIANLIIPGGNSGQYLRTDGTGNLAWATVASDSISNGESNVTLYADLVTMSSNGVANTMVIDGDRVSVDGTLQVNVNAYVSNFIANGSEVSLGNIANLHIYGGNAGQYLQTDGTGTLVWAAVATGDANYANFAGEANIANTANVANTALAVALANVSGAGNIAAINLNGSNTQYLDGTGAWTTITVDHTKIDNGTSNVAIDVADGNVTVGVNGTPNIVQIHEGGLALDGYLETTSRVYPESLEVVDVANIIIPGGANGQVLSTDGNGVLSWVATAAQNAIVNGTSNVTIPSANGNVAFSVGGTTNTAVFSNAVTTFNTDLVVTGNLDIQGNVTYIESNTVNINDKNITLANAAANSVQADGGGFTIAGANATFVYTNSSNSFTSSHSIAAPVFTGIHRGASQDLVVNKSGGALAIGDAVYISGAQGQRIAVAKASNASEGLSAGTIGIIAVGGADNSECYVQYHGVLGGVNTGGLTEGASVFLGATAGTWTTTEPISPAHLVVIGFIQRAHASQGEIYIDVNNFQELAECSDVLLPANVANISNRAILSFDSANSLWIDGTLDMGTY
jgi:hypothetical protein